MIDQFDRERFEEVLTSFGHPWRVFRPLSWGEEPEPDSDADWDSEYRYYIQVKAGVGIHIRSSIHSDGLAADVGEDSIRCWLTSDPRGENPLGTKDARWIARLPGWETRLLRTLGLLFRLGEQLRICPQCLKTGQFKLMGAYKCKNGENRDRWFTKCRRCGHWGGWLRS